MQNYSASKRRARETARDDRGEGSQVYTSACADPTNNDDRKDERTSSTARGAKSRRRRRPEERPRTGTGPADDPVESPSCSVLMKKKRVHPRLRNARCTRTRRGRGARRAKARYVATPGGRGTEICWGLDGSSSPTRIFVCWADPAENRPTTRRARGDERSPRGQSRARRVRDAGGLYVLGTSDKIPRSTTSCVVSAGR